MYTPELITKRLRLRPLTDADTKNIFQCWMNDHEVSKYMCWEATDDINEARDFVVFELSMIDNPQWFRWLIEDKNTCELFGTCLVFYNEEEENYDVSYNLGRQFWGFGYTTEAMHAALDFAVKELDIHEFVTSHAVENPASGNVLKKLGFCYEKDITYICDGGRLTTTGKWYRLKRWEEVEDKELSYTHVKSKNIIHIFGASGAGTSTIGRKICEELGYFFMDTDDYYWLLTNPKFTESRDREERIRMIRQDIAQAENVVISGSLTDWGDELIPLFTLAIRVNTDTKIRIERLKKREYEEFNERILPGGDMYEQHMEFLKWAEEYDAGDISMRSKANHDRWEKLLGCELMVLDGAEDIEKNFKRILEKLRVPE